MNQLGITLLWCVAQVTTIGLLAGGLYLALRRRGPAMGSLVAACGLAAVVLLSLFAVSPWPCWWDVAATTENTSDLDAGRTIAENRVTNDSIKIEQQASSEASRDEVTGNSAISKLPQADTSPSAAAHFWQALREELTRKPVDSQAAEPAWRWQATTASLFISIAIVGLVYLLVALWSLRKVIRRSRSICDSELLKLVDTLRAELGCARKVEVRESDVLFTAATAGWLRPVILLSPQWTTWDHQRRRAVLAHELAHIARGDSLTNLLAQITVAMHFYHPLIHWLVGKLRFEQELAADALAARCAGGRDSYLQSLAEIALRQDEHMLGWPARCFLPTRGTFIRRIEMLRDSKRLPDGRSLFARVAAVGLLALAALLVAGLRSPAGKTTLADETKAEKTQPFDLTYTGDDGSAVLAIRPAAILRHPSMKPIAQILSEPGNEYEKQLGVSPLLIEQLIVADPQVPPARGKSGFGRMFLRTAKPQKLAQFLDTLRRGKGKETNKTHGGKSYVIAPFLGADTAAYQPDDLTVVFDQEENVKRYIDGRQARKKLLQSEAWKQVANDHVAMVVSSSWFRKQLGIEQPGGAPKPGTPQGRMAVSLALFSPLWEEADVTAFGVTFGEKIAVRGFAYCDDEQGAKRVAETIQAAVVLGRNSLKQLRKEVEISKLPGPQEGNAEMQLLSLNVAAELLEHSHVTRDGKVVRFESTVAMNAKLLAALAKATKGARAAARRAQSQNNLKQIALAIHNFHDVNQHLPASAGKKKPGQDAPVKHPVSWRVLLLPYLAQVELYNQYRFDEPWDSEHNLKLAQKMPSVYRHPTAPADTNRSCYYALVGDDTAIGKTKANGFRDITDGTSNTVMIVEAKREIIWTKPEDIPYADDKPLPKLGGYTEGGFVAAFCDGSVQFFSHKSDPKAMRLFITKSDGKPILRQR